MKLSPSAQPHDKYSFSEPDRVRTKHLDLALEVSFATRVIRGAAILTFENSFSGEVVLDTKDLTIHAAEYSVDAATGPFTPTEFELGSSLSGLGAPLRIKLPRSAMAVRVRYETSPHASGLQWLTPEQTRGKKNPFLFTQSEATHARSWIPLQDTPRIRTTLTARVTKPNGLRALMGAVGNAEAFGRSAPEFHLPQPIPSYLLSLAVGDIEFRETGHRTGVFAEPGTIDAASKELEDLEQMLLGAEKLFGPYRWGRYDVLVLPPSFPVGGMENPCLTFATPTILAGDKSLISLIAHELAHAWSSNLVSNATWGEFWINEGFTVYMERRIVEQVFGSRRAEMEGFLGAQLLAREFARLEPQQQALVLNGHEPDPNAGHSQVPYEKGALFLRTIERAVGRPQFDAFLRRFYDQHAFNSITTGEFIKSLNEDLLNRSPAREQLRIDEWISGPGLPSNAAVPHSDAMEQVARRADDWLAERIPTQALGAESWTTQEWLHFLEHVSSQKGALLRMGDLDREFALTAVGNNEILCQWLVMAIRAQYTTAYGRLEEFLTSVGRRKYLKPLYSELAKTDKGRQWAAAIYAKASAGYHPISRQAVEAILSSPSKSPQ